MATNETGGGETEDIPMTTTTDTGYDDELHEEEGYRDTDLNDDYFDDNDDKYESTFGDIFMRSLFSEPTDTRADIAQNSDWKRRYVKELVYKETQVYYATDVNLRGVYGEANRKLLRSLRRTKTGLEFTDLDVQVEEGESRRYKTVIVGSKTTGPRLSKSIKATDKFEILFGKAMVEVEEHSLRSDIDKELKLKEGRVLLESDRKIVVEKARRDKAESDRAEEKARRDKVVADKAEKDKEELLEKQAADKVEREVAEKAQADQAAKDEVDQREADKAERDENAKKAAEDAKKKSDNEEAARAAEVEKVAAEKAVADKEQEAARETDRVEREGLVREIGELRSKLQRVKSKIAADRTKSAEDQRAAERRATIEANRVSRVLRRKQVKIERTQDKARRDIQRLEDEARRRTEADEVKRAADVEAAKSRKEADDVRSRQEAEAAKTKQEAEVAAKTKQEAEVAAKTKQEAEVAAKTKQEAEVKEAVNEGAGTSKVDPVVGTSEPSGEEAGVEPEEPGLVTREVTEEVSKRTIELLVEDLRDIRERLFRSLNKFVGDGKIREGRGEGEEVGMRDGDNEIGSVLNFTDLRSSGTTLVERFELTDINIRLWKKRSIEHEDVDPELSEFYADVAEYEGLVKDLVRLKVGMKPLMERTKGLMRVSIDDSDLLRLGRFKRWAKKNLLGLSTGATTVAAFITSIVMAVRDALRVGVKVAGAFARAVGNILKKMGPIFSALGSIVSTALSWGAKGVGWLASNLWVLAIAVAYALYNRYTSGGTTITLPPQNTLPQGKPEITR